MIGASVTRESVDATLGQITQETNEVFQRVRLMQQWLAGQTTAVLQAPPYNYTAGEVDVIKSAFADLDQLRTIYEGAANLTSAKDFRTFAHQIWGFGF